jgi:hypothetical protein
MQQDKSLLRVGMTWLTRGEEHEFDDLGRNVGEKAIRGYLCQLLPRSCRDRTINL